MLTDVIKAYELASIRWPDPLPDWLSMQALAAFLHQEMRPYEDSFADVERGIEDALRAPPLDGSIHIAHQRGEVLGALVHLRTGMRGYIPENLILFLGVRGDQRGRGIGQTLIEHALGGMHGSVKLHVEPSNPALRLYERLGFSAKYLDLRLER